jgi:NTE family protein
MAETGRRALVLGGGGPVGVAWETGLAAGLKASGVDWAEADLVIGTSAGSLTGAMLMSGEDPVALVDELSAMFAKGVGDSGVDRIEMANLAGLMEMMLGPPVDASGEAARLTEVGRIALSVETVSEDAFVDSIGSTLAGRSWPKGFACTAVRVDTGEFVVWDEEADVPLERAVASSCSVPGLYPPVTIDGHRYMDGGVRSPLNADLAVGHESVAVVSVMMTQLPPGISDPRLEAFFARQREGIDAVRAAGAAVEVIEPDAEFLTLSGMGMMLMDFGLVDAAADAGVRLGKQEAERFRAIW